MSSQTRGACAFCGREMTRSGLARHLPTCTKRKEAEAEAEKTRRHRQKLYHLQVQDAWSGAYWLHMEMRGNATLEDLDQYLRAIWLECCGHLSQFKIGEVAYTQLFDDGMVWREERSMDVRVDEIFEPGMEIPYRYDFGSSTDLLIKVLDMREGKPLTQHPIVLMGRNNPFAPACMVCGQPATDLCTECLYEREDGRCELCHEHALEHEHDDMIVPFANSPRVGVCGYTGPAEPPY